MSDIENDQIVKPKIAKKKALKKVDQIVITVPVVKPKPNPLKWVDYVKDFASKNGLSYKDSLKQAGESYKKSKV